MPNGEERHDSPSARFEYLLERSGSVDPWDFTRLTDEAVAHAADNNRRDELSETRAWRTLGPRNLGGRIRCLAQDERNPNTVYAGSGHGGLWRTNDGGDTWEALDFLDPPGVRHGVPIGAVAVSFSNPNLIYLGTGEPTRSATGGNRDIPGNGLYWSINGGGSFQRIDHPDVGTGTIGASQYETIIVDPWEPKRLWIASPDRGLARGTPPAVSGIPVFQRDTIDHASAAGTQMASDVWVDFGVDRATPPSTVRVYVALWGMGVYRAVYNRNTDTWQGSSGSIWTSITPPAFPANFTRIKISGCRQQPNWISAVAGDPNNAASNVFLSDSHGDSGSWVDTGVRPGDIGTQANYDLLLGLHPSDPSILITGSFELFLGRHNAAAGTTAWTKIIDWLEHDRGDRAQHADQHALLFDHINPNRIWIGNDGGLSTSSDLGGSWRERGLGINAAQFYDITTHPIYPYIFAGGLQDNGTWMSYGGQTWFHVNGGDGFEVAFDPTDPDPRKFFSTTQTGIFRTNIITAANPLTVNSFYVNRLPDLPQVGGNDVNNQASRSRLANGLVPVATNSTFVNGVVAHHPTNPNELIYGWINGGFRTTDGTNFSPLITSVPGATYSVTKIVYSPIGQHPNTHWWVATDQGQLFFTDDNNASPLSDLVAGVSVQLHGAAPPIALNLAGNNITGVAVNRNNDEIIAISVTTRNVFEGAQGFVFLSGDGGATWCEISGRCDPCHSDESDRLNPSVASAIVFDPTSSGDVADAQTLYCGTMAGVYIIRNAIAPNGSITNFSPRWRTFNQSLPLTLVFDLESVQFQDASGTTHNLIRCATHSRGAYECDLAGAPAVKLLIRDTPVDDGNRYDAAHLIPDNHDPRMSDGTDMLSNQAFDIRIDTPPYRFFGSAMDGLEFDEHLRSEPLAAGKQNFVYVQINNVGTGISNQAQLHLYWAQAAGTPLQAPDLQATFWAEYPAVQAGDTWELVASKTVVVVSGQPVVIGFKWEVPGHLTGEVALLAVVDDPDQDALDGLALGNVVDPSNAASFIGTERRTALRQTTVIPAPADALLRDGLDDLGHLGETAWGARSHDIIVVQTPEADPNTAFADANDLRTGDIISGSATNHIYVRIQNIGGSALTNVTVEVFRIPLNSLQDPNTWAPAIGSANVASVNANSSVIMPSINWVNPADPAPNTSYLLFALVQADNDPRPDFLTRVNSLQSVWDLVLQAVDGGNAVLRGIRWQA